MLEICHGDILKSKAQTLVSPVNCSGIIEKGVSVAIKKAFPVSFMNYYNVCMHQSLQIGHPYLCKQYSSPWILYFPTKPHWRSSVKAYDIIKGLDFLRTHYKQLGIDSIAMPALGCEEGQLSWNLFGPTLCKYLEELDIPVKLYISSNEETSSLIDPVWFAIVEIVNRIESHSLHWSVGINKLKNIIYFATELGLPTDLKYQRSFTGLHAPFVELKIISLLNNGLLQEEQLGKISIVRSGEVFSNIRFVFPETWISIIDKLADFFSSLDAEDADIAAEVLFTFKHAVVDKPTEVELLEKSWEEIGKGKNPPPKEKVASMVRALNMLNFLDAKISSKIRPNAEFGFIS